MIMKLSDVIRQLQDIKDREGDLEFLVTKTILDWEYRLEHFKVVNRKDSYS